MWPSFFNGCRGWLPTRQIDLIVGYAPGAGTDLGARMVAEMSKKSLGQEIVISNRPGASGKTAMTLISKAKPDGYTLGATTDASVTWLPHIEPTEYEPFKDFTFLIQYGILDQWLVVPYDSPFHSVKDFIQYARANPGKLNVSTVGVGGGCHTVVQALGLIEKVKINLVPFPGAAPALTNLLGGHTQAACSPPSVFGPQLEAKKVRPLVLIGDERASKYPEYPTLKELGYPSNLSVQSWYIIFGPKNMEKSVVQKLQDEFNKAMETPQFLKLVKDIEIWAPNPLVGNTLTEAMVQRYAKYGELFKQLGMAIK